jgi:hypothetical protein
MTILNIHRSTFKLNEDWNLITRWILPVVYRPPLFQGDSSDFGLGNFNPGFFFVTMAGSNITWGLARRFSCPRTRIGASDLTIGARDQQA